MTSLGSSENSRFLRLKVWPEDLHTQNHLGTSGKYRISAPAPDLMS